MSLESDGSWIVSESSNPTIEVAARMSRMMAREEMAGEYCYSYKSNGFWMKVHFWVNNVK